jgi:hypothetical protein
VVELESPTARRRRSMSRADSAVETWDSRAGLLCLQIWPKRAKRLIHVSCSDRPTGNPAGSLAKKFPYSAAVGKHCTAVLWPIPRGSSW